jgi:hypothetical protein
MRGGTDDNASPPCAGRAVFACFYHEPLRSTILPLAKRLQRGAMRPPIVVLEDDAAERMAGMCDAAEVAFQHVSERNWRGDTAAEALPPASLKAGHRATVRRIGNGLPRRLVRLGQTFWRLRRQIARRTTLLKQLDASVLVLLDDRTLHGCRWVRAAQRCGIPVVVVQWAATHRAAVLARLRAARQGPLPTGWLVGILERYVAKRVPQGVRYDRGAPVWWIPPEVTLAHHWLGAYPQTTPWAYGGGNSTVVTVLGEAWKRRLVADDVPAEKLVVTGHPEQDRWYRYATKRSSADAAAVARDLDIAADKRIVTIVAPALTLRRPGEGREGDIGVADLREDLRAAVRAVRDLGPRFVPVVKAHPRDSADALASLHSGTARPPCVVTDYPFERLIGASHAMACQWSTAALIGLALDVPVLLFDFHNSPSAALWKDVDGLPHAESIDQFGKMLRDSLLDSAETDRSLADRRRPVDDYLCYDGNACARIAQVIEMNG